MSQIKDWSPRKIHEVLYAAGMPHADALTVANATNAVNRQLRTMRDEFAAQFLAASIAKAGSPKPLDMKSRARHAYALADAMLQVRDEEVKS